MKENMIVDACGIQCDCCGRDYDNSSESGGILFSSRAVCPKCAPALEADAVKYGETEYIFDRCPKGMSFRDWCIRLRNREAKKFREAS